VALNKVIAEVKDAPKTEQGFGYKYSSLDNILKMLRPILAANGLAIIQSQEIKESSVVVKTLLTHTSGEWLEVTTEAPFISLKGMNDYQAVGAGITYLRRYSISNLFAISSEEDTDGVSKAVPQNNNYNQTQSNQTQNQSANNQNQEKPNWKQLGIEFTKTNDGKYIATEVKKGAIFENKELLKRAGFRWDNNTKSWVKSA
jgi:hypothetical protein